MLFKLGNRGKLSIPGRERHAVSYVSVTTSLIVKKTKIPFEPCSGRHPSRGDIQGHNSSSQKVVNKTENSGQINASNHSSLRCHLAELQGILGIPSKKRGGTLLRAQGEGQIKYKSLTNKLCISQYFILRNIFSQYILYWEASMRHSGEAGGENRSRWIEQNWMLCTILPSNKGFFHTSEVCRLSLRDQCPGDSAQLWLCPRDSQRWRWQEQQGGTQVSHPHCESAGVPTMSDLSWGSWGSFKLQCSHRTNRKDLYQL